MLEALEDRVVLSQTYTVNVATDNGGANGQGNGLFGDLRYCCANAETGDTIIFAGLSGKTINLNSEIQLETSATIDGNGQNVTISGQNKTRIFEVMAGASYTINGLTFTGGNGTDGQGKAGNGGAILVDSLGSLTLNSDNFNSNNTTGAGKNGGAIENDGVTSVYGCTFLANNSINNGGAIENTHNLEVDQLQSSPYKPSTFNSNTAAGTGGAIDSSGGGVVGTQLTVSNSTFASNRANGNGGGAIATNDPATLQTDQFGQQGANLAPNGFGGAIYAAQGTGPVPSELTVNGCTLANNEAPSGGAVYTSTSTDINLSRFTNNQASTAFGGVGGAIYASISSLTAGGTYTVTINLDTFKDNSAGSGGALYSSNSANPGDIQVNVTNDTFYNNHAESTNVPPIGTGGGLDLLENTAGAGSSVSAALTNDTFFQNSANSDAGGLYLSLADSTGSNQYAKAVLTSLTVSQNTGDGSSGGLYVDSALRGVVPVDNSILSGNTVDAGGNNVPADAWFTNNNVSLKDLGYNLVGLNATMFNAGTDPARTDKPGLAAFLAQNGAPTGYPQTLALQVGSPGYRKGDQTLAGQSGALGQDERTYTRQVGKVSIGAEDPDAVLLQQQGQTFTAVASSANPALPGQLVTFTASVTGAGGIPTGTVTFEDGSTVLGTSTLDASGNAAFTASSLALGSHNITATYNGDSNFSGSSGSLTQVISQENTNFVSLSSSAPTNATLNQSITFTATVNGSSGTPTGSVTFLDGDTVLGSANLDGTGKATFATSALSLGSHDITAVYGGDSTYGSNSTSMNQTVNQGGTSTYLSLSANPAQPGQPVTFTATLTYNQAAGTPTGDVTFLDGTTILGTGALSQVGSQMQATFTTSTLSSGSHSVTAVYGGDDIFAASSSSTIETVGQASGVASTISVSASSNPALLNQPVTLTATVSGLSGTPSGSVTFLDGTTVLGTATLSVVNGQNQASLTTSALELGFNDIIAVYSGDSTYAASANSLTLSVNQGGTTTSLSSSANPSPAGQPVTFTATVMAMGMGVPAPTGTVSFFDGTTFLGNGTLTLVNGQMQATFTTAALGLGSHRIIAIYSGDGTFADSSAALQQTISN